MNAISPTAIREGDVIASVDLGSNSFHLLVARYELGSLQIIDRMREMVRLAAGLGEDGGLDVDHRNRALACLARFGQRLRDIPAPHVRAMATNTVRRLADPRSFLVAGEAALGHAIEVAPGREEARLIYLGVAHAFPQLPGRRLVVDIGGGSTEFIIGKGLDALETESLQMGCVVSTRHLFPDGRITRKRWENARTELAVELRQFAPNYRARGWSEAIGSSGTIKALGGVSRAMGVGDWVVTRDSLTRICDAIITAGHVDAIDLPDLSEQRRPVIAGGAVILDAVFDVLELERMRISDSALREGVLWDMIGRAEQRDPRERAVASWSQRYSVDLAQAARVETTAAMMFNQLRSAWNLEDAAEGWLRFAARLHEIGFAVAHSQHQLHAAYLVENGDLPGFSAQEQQILAFLLHVQRRAPGTALERLQQLPDRLQQPALAIAVILRLSILLHRARSDEAMPPIALRAGPRSLRLALDDAWLEVHPLTRADLARERKSLAGIDFKLVLGST